MAEPGARDRRFPRSGGVVVPALLRELCRRADVSTDDSGGALLSDEQRHKSARLVIRAVARNLNRLDGPVLQTALPPPSVVLRTLVVDDRTRFVIGRWRSPSPAALWSVEHYLRLPGFGAHCLVDLLAACEEAERATPLHPGPSQLAAASPLSISRLDEISTLLVRRAPFGAADIGRLLLDAGLATAPVTLAELAATYRRLDANLPIRIVRHHRGDVIVPVGAVGVAASIISTAVRFVANWGMATLQAVGDRVGTLRATGVAREIAGRVVVSLPSFVWLDQANGWFTLRGVRSRLATSIDQAFAIADRISLDELAGALAKRRSHMRNIGPLMLASYLRTMCGCQIADGWVHPPANRPAPALSAAEQRVAEILARAGRELGTESLNAQAAAHAIARAQLRVLIDESPLFVRGPADRVRLIGEGTSLSALG